MVRVHTIHDFQQASPSYGSQPSYAYTESRSWKEIVFPGFRLKTFIFWMSMFQIGIYLALLLCDNPQINTSSVRIGPWLVSDGRRIAKGEVWRLISPILMHSGFLHLIANMFFQLRMGFSLERDYGTGMFAAIYFTCGLIGNLVSVAWVPCKIATGASTSGFGLIGMTLSTVVINWHNNPFKQQTIMNVVFLCLLTIMMSVGNTNIDWRGHLGGFISGVGIYFAMPPPTETSLPGWHKSVSYISSALVSAVALACIAIIFAIPMTDRC